MSNSHFVAELSEQDAIESVLMGHDISEAIITPAQVYNTYISSCLETGCKVVDMMQVLESISASDYINALSSVWLIPQSYLDFNIEEYLINRCTSDDELKRVKYELEIFKRKNLIVVLQALKFIIDTFREQGIVWGVGRGSSTASMCLYLLDVHRVNPLKYKLDIHEFLKE